MLEWRAVSSEKRFPILICFDNTVKRRKSEHTNSRTFALGAILSYPPWLCNENEMLVVKQRNE